MACFVVRCLCEFGWPSLSEAAFLGHREKLTARLPDVHVVCPAKCDLAVVLGGLLAPLNADLVEIRKFPVTVGVDEWAVFHPKTHKDRVPVTRVDPVTQKPVKYVTGLFKPLVLQNEDIKCGVDAKRALPFERVERKQKAMHFGVYTFDGQWPASQGTKSVYVDGPGFVRRGDLHLQMDENKDNPIRVYSDVSSAEFKIVAFDEATGLPSNIVKFDLVRGPAHAKACLEPSLSGLSQSSPSLGGGSMAPRDVFAFGKCQARFSVRRAWN